MLTCALNSVSLSTNLPSHSANQERHKILGVQFFAVLTVSVNGAVKCCKIRWVQLEREVATMSKGQEFNTEQSNRYQVF